MELEIINKLYLELSQIATAETASNKLLGETNKRRLILLRDIFNCDELEHLPSDIKRRIGNELL